MTVAPNGTLDEVASGVQNETDYFAVAVHMLEGSGNDYKGKSVDIDVTVPIKQASAEEDGFGNPDPNGAHDTTLTFKNCRIEATQTTGNEQYLLSVRAMGTVINVENCTFYIDGEQIDSTLEAVAPHIGVTSQEIAEDLTVNFK